MTFLVTRKLIRRDKESGEIEIFNRGCIRAESVELPGFVSVGNDEYEKHIDDGPHSVRSLLWKVEQIH